MRIKSISQCIDIYIYKELESFLTTSFPAQFDSSALATSLNLNHKAFRRFILGCSDWKLVNINKNQIECSKLKVYSFDEIEFSNWMNATRNKPFRSEMNLGDLNLEIKNELYSMGYVNVNEMEISLVLFLREILSRILLPSAIWYTLKTNQNSFNYIFGFTENNSFSNYKNEKTLMQIFSSRFALQWQSDDKMLIEKLDLRGKKILDLGAGSGGLALALENAKVKVEKYFLFDLLTTQECLTETRRNYFQMLESPKEIIYGNFFESSLGNPQFYQNEKNKIDVVFLSWIIHDWDDHKSKMIIESIKPLLSKDGIIVVVEKCTDSSRFSMMNFADYLILATVDGLERTLTEYNSLFESLNFKLKSHLYFQNSRDFLIYSPF